MRKSIFHEEWWLDALAPRKWRQVVCDRGGQIVGVLPFVEQSRAGLKICTMPHPTRVLGPVVVPQPGKPEASARSTHSIIANLLQQIAAHHHVEMTLDSAFTDLTPFLHAGYEVKAHPTLLLDCAPELPVLWAGLRDKTRNAIRRAQERLVVQEVDDVSRFARFYADNLEDDAPYFDLAQSAAAISAACDRKQCKIVAVLDAGGTTHAMVVFIWDDRYVYYFQSSRNKAQAHAGAVSLLVWTGIELAHARGLVFDFDGGLVKASRYKFLISFGGEIANRYEVSRSTRIYAVHHAVRRLARAVARKLSATNLLKRKKFGLAWWVVCGLCMA